MEAKLRNSISNSVSFLSYSLISLSYLRAAFWSLFEQLILAFLWLSPHTVGYSLIIYRGQKDFLLDLSVYYQTSFKLYLLFQKESTEVSPPGCCHCSQVVVIQLLSHVQPFVTPWTPACQASLPFTISRSLPKLMSIESVMPYNHLVLCLPRLLLPSVFPSIRVFSNELALHIRWSNYWSFSFSISPFREYSGLISFKMDWLDLLAVQETLKSLLQHHSSKASILQCSAFFIVQLSHPYMTTGQTIALTRWTFVGKVMSLLFNMLSTC